MILVKCDKEDCIFNENTYCNSNGLEIKTSYVHSFSAGRNGKEQDRNL